MSRRHLRRAIAAGAVLALAAAGCGGSARSTEPAQPSLFDYDTALPLAYTDRGRVNKNYPIAVHNVSYASRSGRVEGFLAVPPGSGRLPAVVYVHGSGGDRTEMIFQASWLAARGAVALAITAPSAAAAPTSNLKPIDFLRWQRELTVRDVVAVRRAVDLLQTLPRVDPDRIGYTGFSSGARLGAIVAAVEPRFQALDLMSAGSAPVSAYVAQAPRALKTDVGRILGQTDPIRYVAQARPGTLQLQDGRQDEIIPRAALMTIVRAAPDRTVVRWYAAGHAPNNAAWHDQLSWMSEKLGIDGPRVPGAKTGP